MNFSDRFQTLGEIIPRVEHVWLCLTRVYSFATAIASFVVWSSFVASGRFFSLDA